MKRIFPFIGMLLFWGLIGSSIAWFMHLGTVASTVYNKVVVDKIFVGNSCQYTVFKQNDDKTSSGKPKTVQPTTYHGVVPTIIEDVPADQKCWIVVREDILHSGQHDNTKLSEVHIHHLSDLNPGGWMQHNGKGPIITGMNTEIQ